MYLFLKIFDKENAPIKAMKTKIQSRKKSMYCIIMLELSQLYPLFPMQLAVKSIASKMSLRLQIKKCMQARDNMPPKIPERKLINMVFLSFQQVRSMARNVNARRESPAGIYIKQSRPRRRPQRPANRYFVIFFWQ